jgi:hypothetical protein
MGEWAVKRNVDLGLASTIAKSGVEMARNRDPLTKRRGDPFEKLAKC